MDSDLRYQHKIIRQHCEEKGQFTLLAYYANNVNSQPLAEFFLSAQTIMPIEKIMPIVELVATFTNLQYTTPKHLYSLQTQQHPHYQHQNTKKFNKITQKKK